MGRLTLYHRYPMKKSRTIQLAMGLYEILWRVGTPLLKHHPRLREGFAHRAAADHLSGADIWIHAASAGEAFLSLSLIDGLHDGALSRILVTTNTRQGLDIIQNGVAQVSGNRPVSVMTDYMPFDRPRLMEQAVSKVSPKAMILLETELWPGLLMALKKNSIPSLLVNGRLTPKSLKQYMLWPELWSTLSPDHVLAISEEDAARFSALFGCETVRTMKNIKFDRLNTAPHPATGHLKSLIPENHPFLVLGSVRREEEKPVEAIIRRVLSDLPETVIGLFPRHMERIDHWTSALDQLAVPWQRRSCIDRSPVSPGTVVLWDVFGELNPAYALARAVFVGGSLAPLGGQNFLEPMIYGLTPVIGPSWENFAWAGDEIFHQKLAVRTDGWQSAAAELVRQLRHPDRDEHRKDTVKNYLEIQKGGTAQACRLITQTLKSVNFNRRPAP